MTSCTDKPAEDGLPKRGRRRVAKALLLTAAVGGLIVGGLIAAAALRPVWSSPFWLLRPSMRPL